MDPSLAGLLGAYGSGDEEEEDNVQILSPGAVAAQGSKADVSPEAILPEGAAVSAGLMLPLSAAPDVREPADPAKLEDASEPLQLSREDEAKAEQPDKFWLPEEIAQEPGKKCPADVQEKVKEYISVQEKTGNTITSSLKALSGYKNPDFLQHCVKYDNIDQYGSCYPKDVFDPAGLPAEDYYDRLAYEWEQQLAKRQAAQASRTDFVSRGSEQTRAMPAGLQPSAMTASTMKAEDMLARAKAKAARGKWDSRR